MSCSYPGSGYEQVYEPFRMQTGSGVRNYGCIVFIIGMGTREPVYLHFCMVYSPLADPLSVGSLKYPLSRTMLCHSAVSAVAVTFLASRLGSDRKLPGTADSTAGPSLRHGIGGDLPPSGQ